MKHSTYLKPPKYLNSDKETYKEKTVGNKMQIKTVKKSSSKQKLNP